MMKHLTYAVAFFTALLWTSASYASFETSTPFAIEPNTPQEELDQPKTPTLSLSSITRGVGPQSIPCQQGTGECFSVSSLDPYGFIYISLSPTQEEVGYIAEVVSGDAPQGLVLLDTPLEAKNDSLSFHWEDGATDEQEPLDFELRVIPVNRAGEQGNPSAPLLISDPGRAAEEDEPDMSDEDAQADSDTPEEDEEESATCSSTRSNKPLTTPMMLLMFCLVAGWRRLETRKN